MPPDSTESLSTLIQRESMEKARITDGPSYEFPEQLAKIDWLATGIIVASMLLLTIVGFWF
jgi:hypothetical protein